MATKTSTRWFKAMQSKFIRVSSGQSSHLLHVESLQQAITDQTLQVCMPRDLFNVDDSQMSQALPQVGALPLLSGLPQGGGGGTAFIVVMPFALWHSSETIFRGARRFGSGRAQTEIGLFKGDLARQRRRQWPQSRTDDEMSWYTRGKRHGNVPGLMMGRP